MRPLVGGQTGIDVSLLWQATASPGAHAALTRALQAMGENEP